MRIKLYQTILNYILLLIIIISIKNYFVEETHYTCINQCSKIKILSYHNTLLSCVCILILKLIISIKIYFIKNKLISVILRSKINILFFRL